MKPKRAQELRTGWTRAGVGTIAGILAVASPSRASEVCVANASGPDICVNKGGASPILGINFRLDYAVDPSNPSVELLTGDLSWNVRSDDNGSPGNIGSITIDPVLGTENYGVKIANGSNPGAAQPSTPVETLLSQGARSLLTWASGRPSDTATSTVTAWSICSICFACWMLFRVYSRIANRSRLTSSLVAAAER